MDYFFIPSVVSQGKVNEIGIVSGDCRSEAFLAHCIVKLRLRRYEALEEIIRLLQIHFFHDAAEDVWPHVSDQHR